MKKLILTLLFFTGFLQAQTLQNPTYGNTTTNTLKIKTPATVTSVNFLTVVEADGSVNKIAPININIPYDPTNYTIANQTIGAQLGGIDVKLGQKSDKSESINSLFTHSGVKSIEHSGDPQIIENPLGGFIMYSFQFVFDGTDMVKCRAHTASSLTGTWTEVNANLLGSGTNYHKFVLLLDVNGNPVQIGGKYHGYSVKYLGTETNKRVDHFESASLLSGWTLTGTAIPVGLQGTYDTAAIDAPCAIYDNGAIYLYYMASPLVSQPDFGLAQRHLLAKSTNPASGFVYTSTVLTPSTNPNDFDYGWIGGIQLLKVNGKYNIIYNASITRPSTAGNEPVPSRVGMAYTDNLETMFTKAGVILSPEQNIDFEIDNIWRPYLIFDKKVNNWKIFYNTGTTNEIITYAYAGGIFDSQKYLAKSGYGYNVDFNTRSNKTKAIGQSGLFVADGSFTNPPSTDTRYNVINITDPIRNSGLTIASGATATASNVLKFKSTVDGVNGSWNEIYHTGNLTPNSQNLQSVTNIGNVTTNHVRILTGANTADISYAVGKELNEGMSAFFGWRYNSGSPYGFLTMFGATRPIAIQPDGGNTGFGGVINPTRVIDAGTNPIKVGDGVNPTDAATKAQLDAVSALDANNVKLTGNQTKNGQLTINSNAGVPALTAINTSNVAAIQASSNSATGIEVSSTSGRGIRVNNSTGNTSDLITLNLNNSTKFNVDYLGNSTSNSFIKIGGTPEQILHADGSVSSILSGSAVLDFPATATGSSSELTITVTGASEGDVVALGVPNASADANTTYAARVSASNTVTVKHNNYGSGSSNPASGTFKVKVFK